MFNHSRIPDRWEATGAERKWIGYWEVSGYYIFEFDIDIAKSLELWKVTLFEREIGEEGSILSIPIHYCQPYLLVTYSISGRRCLVRSGCGNAVGSGRRVGRARVGLTRIAGSLLENYNCLQIHNASNILQGTVFWPVRPAGTDQRRHQPVRRLIKWTLSSDFTDTMKASKRTTRWICWEGWKFYVMI